MADPRYQIRQIADVLHAPDSGKQSIVLADDAHARILLFAFAAGEGLAEHVASMPAILQIIQGEAALKFGDEPVDGKPGTWVRMDVRTPHSILAKTPLVMLLTLLKAGRN